MARPVKPMAERLIDKVTFLGKECKRCGTRERYTSTKRCYQCKRVRNVISYKNRRFNIYEKGDRERLSQLLNEYQYLHYGEGKKQKEIGYISKYD